MSDLKLYNAAKAVVDQYGWSMGVLAKSLVTALRDALATYTPAVEISDECWTQAWIQTSALSLACGEFAKAVHARALELASKPKYTAQQMRAWAAYIRAHDPAEGDRTAAMLDQAADMMEGRT